MSGKRKRSGDEYASLWRIFDCDNIQQIDAEESVESTADQLAEPATSSVLASGSSTRRPVGSFAKDLSLLAMCPLSMRVSMEKTKAQWSRLENSRRCLRSLDILYQLSDEQLAVRFIDLFDRATQIVEKALNETAAAKRKDVLMQQFYQLLIEQRNWGIYGGDIASSLSDAEKRHTTAMIIENLLAHLLHLTTPDVVMGLNTDDAPVSDQSENAAAEEEAIYYVGGFLIRKLLKKITPASPLTTEVHNLLLHCISDNSVLPPTASSWTNDLNRGGLVFISGHCFDVFLEVEKCAKRQTPYQETIKNADVDAALFSLAIAPTNEYSDNALEMFKSVVVREFYGLRGKAVAKKRLEDAILSDNLVQERRGLRSKLQRVEGSRASDNIGSC